MDVDRPLLADAPSSTGPMARLFAERYQLVARRGSNVDVARFDAHDLQTGRPVVVRIVHPDLCALDGFRDRFTSTMSVVMAHPHPNLAEVHDIGEAEWGGRRVLYVVGEQLSGGSLRDLRDRGRVLSQSQAVMIGLDACRGLDVAHRAGLVHGDIRPANLVFGDDGRLRLTDLGLASVVSHELWKTPESLNLDRARFASPEQALGRPAEQKSDVYSLCLCLVEAITGQVPFVGESTVMTLSNRVDRLLPVTADLGPLAAVLERAGRPDPGDRSSVAEFGRALVTAAERLPRPAPLPLLGAGLFAEAPPAVGASDTSDGEPDELAVAGEPSAVEVSDADLVGAGPVGVIPAGVGVAGAGGDGAAPAPDPLPVAPVAMATAVGGSEPAPLAAGATPPEQAPSPVPEVARAMNGASLDETVALAISEASTQPIGPSGDAVLRPVGVSASPTSTPARRSLVVPRWALLALVAAVVALGGYLLFGRTASHEVPLLAGLEQAEALNLVAEFGWEVTTIDEASPTVPVGAVVRTDPPGGARLDEGSTLTMFVSSGPALAVLPELTGLSVDEASRLLSDVGAVMQLGAEPFDESVPAGLIVSWVVPDQPGLVAGATVVPGTTVSVTVSSGPAPRQVPELTGMSLIDATTMLQTLGLSIVQAPDAFNQFVPVGAIAEQDPPAGTEVTRGATVTVVVSKGAELVSVPPLAGLGLAGITAALEGAGLVLGEVEGDLAGVIREARSGETVLAGGEQVPKGSRIDVTLAAPAVAGG